MNCEQAAAQLIESLYGDVIEQSAELDAHLAACEHCRAEAAQLRHSHRALSLLNEDFILPGHEGPAVQAHEDADQRHDAASITGVTLQRHALQTEGRSRRWRGLGILAAAACVMMIAAVLLGLRVNWKQEGVSLAWGQTSSTIPDLQGLQDQIAQDHDRWREAEDLLRTQQAEIAQLKSTLSDYQQTQIEQQQLNQELVSAVQRQFVALQMQMERSDFRISLLKANVRDLGSVLARVSAAVGRPVAMTSTPGE